MTVSVSQGHLELNDFTFRSDGSIEKIHLADDGAEFAGARISITVKTPQGVLSDHQTSVGKIDASGLDLASVRVAGSLGKILVGDRNLDTPALGLLRVDSLGVAAQPDAAPNAGHSEVHGRLGRLVVTGDLTGTIEVTGGSRGSIGDVVIRGDLDGSAGGHTAGLIRAHGSIDHVTVRGDVLGGATLSGIISGEKLGTVTIFG